MSKKNSRVDLLAADQNLIDGTQKNASKLPASFPVGSVTMTPQDVVTVLQGRVTTGKAVVQAESARTAAVQTDRTTRAQSQTRVSAFKRIVIAMFLESPDVLGDFGLAAPKPPQKSAQVKAQAAAKGAATRKAKGAQAAAPAAEPAAPAAAPAAPAAAPAAAAKPVS
ncbi:MAG TPA: hypothetical protein VGL81_05025 [Polyangiaceae bacterium]|jgi:hypothetical protein